MNYRNFSLFLILIPSLLFFLDSYAWTDYFSILRPSHIPHTISNHDHPYPFPYQCFHSMHGCEPYYDPKLLLQNKWINRFQNLFPSLLTYKPKIDCFNGKYLDRQNSFLDGFGSELVHYPNILLFAAYYNLTVLNYAFESSSHFEEQDSTRDRWLQFYDWEVNIDDYKTCPIDSPVRKCVLYLTRNMGYSADIPKNSQLKYKFSLDRLLNAKNLNLIHGCDPHYGYTVLIQDLIFYEPGSFHIMPIVTEIRSFIAQRHLRASIFESDSEDDFHLSIHVRRGDITPNGMVHPNQQGRVMTNDNIIFILKSFFKAFPSSLLQYLKVHILSEAQSNDFLSITQFLKSNGVNSNNIRLLLDSQLRSTQSLGLMIESDFVICSLSAFSQSVPLFYSGSLKIAPEYTKTRFIGYRNNFRIHWYDAPRVEKYIKIDELQNRIGNIDSDSLSQFIDRAIEYKRVQIGNPGIPLFVLNYAESFPDSWCLTDRLDRIEELRYEEKLLTSIPVQHNFLQSAASSFNESVEIQLARPIPPVTLGRQILLDFKEVLELLASLKNVDVSRLLKNYSFTPYQKSQIPNLHHDRHGKFVSSSSLSFSFQQEKLSHDVIDYPFQNISSTPSATPSVIRNYNDLRLAVEPRVRNYVVRANYNVDSGNLRFSINDFQGSIPDLCLKTGTDFVRCDVKTDDIAFSLCDSIPSCAGFTCLSSSIIHPQQYPSCTLFTHPHLLVTALATIMYFKNHSLLSEAELSTQKYIQAAWPVKAGSLAPPDMNFKGSCGFNLVCVVSMSLYGNKRLYLDTFFVTVSTFFKYYSGWQLWVYVDSSVPPSDIDRLMSHKNPSIVLKNMTGEKIIVGSIAGMFWRFLVAGEPAVDRYIIRDSDSVFSLREVKAVNEWLRSGFTFHIIKDHPYHRHLVMGGMWGGSRGALSNIRPMIESWGQYDKYSADQAFLAEKVAPIIMKDVITHDSWNCLNVANGQPFPHPRDKSDGFFIGDTVHPVYFNDSTHSIFIPYMRFQEAPLACRAKFSWRFG